MLIYCIFKRLSRVSDFVSDKIYHIKVAPDFNGKVYLFKLSSPDNRYIFRFVMVVHDNQDLVTIGGERCFIRKIIRNIRCHTDRAASEKFGSLGQDKALRISLNR